MNQELDSQHSLDDWLATIAAVLEPCKSFHHTMRNSSFLSTKWRVFSINCCCNLAIQEKAETVYWWLEIAHWHASGGL